MTVPSGVAYVTACALGLAFSEHRDTEAVHELVRAAGGRAEVLDEALAMLPTYPGQDPVVVRAATELLIAAVSTLRSGATATG